MYVSVNTLAMHSLYLDKGSKYARGVAACWRRLRTVPSEDDHGAVKMAIVPRIRLVAGEVDGVFWQVVEREAQLID